MKSLTSKFLMLVILALPGMVVAQSHDSAEGDHDNSGHEAAIEGEAHDDNDHGAADHEGEHHGHHKNILAGFIGITGVDRREHGLTLGVEYTRWITPSWAIGVGAEEALGDLNFFVVTVPITFRYNNWKFFAGPGWEKPDEDNPLPGSPPVNPGARSGSTPFDNSTQSLVRVGVEYEINRGSYELGPKIMIDIIDGDIVVIGGVAIGFGF